MGRRNRCLTRRCSRPAAAGRPAQASSRPAARVRGRLAGRPPVGTWYLHGGRQLSAGPLGGSPEANLQGSDALSTIAEVGLGLAGFTGILVALGRSPGAFSRPEVLRLLLLLVTSFGAVFLSLLPFAIHESGVTGSACWRLSSALLAAFTSVPLAYLGYRVRRHRDEFGRVLSHTVFAIVGIGSSIIVVLQLFNVAGLGAPPRLGPYLFGLLWLLFVASLQFARILFVRFPGE